MHPHDNPQYQQQILTSFYKFYTNKTLVLQDSPEATQFEAEVNKEAKRLFFSSGLSIVGTLYVDYKYFIPKFGRIPSVNRFLAFGVTYFALVNITSMMVLSRNKIGLAKKLCFMNEQQILDLDPKLRMFYLPMPDVSRTNVTQDRGYQLPGGEAQDNYQSSTASEYGQHLPANEWRERDWRGDSWRPGNKE